jgi:predicted nuclease of predicted toxin-antitoxin system
LRFFLDHNVPVSVRGMLVGLGHECWTASEAGLAAEGQDDVLSVYADSRQAALVTFDREFSRRRLKNPIGRHVWLHCSVLDAAAVLESHLGQVLDLLHREHVTIEVRQGRVFARSKAS